MAARRYLGSSLRVWGLVIPIYRVLIAFAAVATLLGSGCRFASDPAAAVIAPREAATELFIAPSTLELSRGFTPTEAISARLTTGGLPEVSWSSSDTTVAMLTPLDKRSARVSGRRAGRVIVSATTSDGLRASATVIVAEQPPLEPDPVPPREANIDGIVVHAITRADSSPAGAPRGAVSYTTTATLRNAGRATRTIDLDACPIWTTLHGGGGWYMQEMRPLEWDQMLADGACGDQPKRVTLAPGAAYDVHTSVFAHDLLAAGVRPNHRSYFHAHVRFDTSQVVVQADSAVISYPSDALAPKATTTIAGSDTVQTLRADVTLTNLGELPAYLEFGACAVRLFAYATPDRSGAPLWDSNLRRPWVGTYGTGCILVLITKTIQPGDSIAFGLGPIPLIEMLADSLSDGRYYFSADVGFSNRAAIHGIPAGSAELAMPRASLPSTRIADLLTDRASPVSVAGTPAVVTEQVSATLDYAGSAIISFSHGCPLVLYAYRDRARRDAAPRSGAADWTQPVACGTQQDQVILSRGGSRTLETSVRAADILGSSLPSGRYYFAVALHAEGNRVMLSAGDAQLSR